MLRNVRKIEYDERFKKKIERLSKSSPEEKEHILKILNDIENGIKDAKEGKKPQSRKSYYLVAYKEESDRIARKTSKKERRRDEFEEEIEI